MKKLLLFLFASAFIQALPAVDISFPKAGLAITAPDGWSYETTDKKAFAANPDKVGKIQAFVTNIPNVPIEQAVKAYFDSVFKNAESPRPGHPVVVLESSEFKTASGLVGAKGAFGYSQGANGGPEVWTWRYFFPRPDGKIVSVCSFVYGDPARATAQEAIIAEGLHFVP